MKAIKIAVIATLLCFLYVSLSKDIIFLAVLIAWIYQCGKNEG